MMIYLPLLSLFGCLLKSFLVTAIKQDSYNAHARANCHQLFAS